MVTAGDTIMIHKDDLSEGENVIELTVFGRLGGRVVMTSTLMIGTIDNIDQTVCAVECSGTYDSNGVYITCYELEDIQSITYTINGGSSMSGSRAGFLIDGNLLVREQNNIELTVACREGGSSVINLLLTQPLSVSCNTQSVEDGVDIQCISNRQSSTLDMQCDIDGTPLANCDLDMFLSYSNTYMSEGQHKYTVNITDSHGQSQFIQISFYVKPFEICCFGVYSSIDDIIHMSCDANRPVANCQYQVNGGSIIQHDLPTFDISVSNIARRGTISVTVEAEDRHGNTATSQLIFTC